MPTIEQIARDDLKKKIEFERLLATDISFLNSKIVKDFIRKLDNGEIAQAEDYREELEAILSAHYELVGDHFDSRIRGDLPEEVAITDGEVAVIASALALYYLTRRGNQSAFITKTTQNNIADAVAFGLEDAARSAQDGIQLSQREIAVVSGSSLSRKLRGRALNIASTETQNIAEAAKATEAEVLAGRTPSISGGTPEPSNIQKQWVTAGDERVRRQPFNHVAADAKKVDIGDAYTVSGQLLRWPGDTELGASVGNVAHCRCASIENRDQILSARVDTRAQILEQARLLLQAEERAGSIL